MDFKSGTQYVLILKSMPSEADNVCVISARHYESTEDSFAEMVCLLLMLLNSWLRWRVSCIHSVVPIQHLNFDLSSCENIMVAKLIGGSWIFQMRYWNMNVDFVQSLGVYSCAWNWKLGVKKNSSKKPHTCCFWVLQSLFLVFRSLLLPTVGFWSCLLLLGMQVQSALSAAYTVPHLSLLASCLGTL